MSVVRNGEVTIFRFLEVKNILDPFRAVLFTEVVHILEGPLREVPLYGECTQQARIYRKAGNLVKIGEKRAKLNIDEMLIWRF